MNLKAMLLGLLVQQSLVNMREVSERRLAFNKAKEYADNLGKPLLVVGTPRLGHLHHPCGDVTIDTDPRKLPYCNTELADVRDIPYPDRYFGAAFVSHVLEHLPTIQDAYEALDELHRVADKVFVVSPSKMSLIAQLHPDHHLWVTSIGDDFIIQQRGIRPIKAVVLTE